MTLRTLTHTEAYGSLQTDSVRYSTRPLEGRVHVTLRAAIPIRFAVRNTLCECVRAIQLGFSRKHLEKHLEFQVGL